MLTATVAGAGCITAIKIFASSFAWRLKRSGYLVQILYNFRQYARYPLSIFPGVIRWILSFVLPFGLISSLPVETVFFSTYNPLILSAGILLMCAVMNLIAGAVWTFNIRRYESTGS